MSQIIITNSDMQIPEDMGLEIKKDITPIELEDRGTYIGNAIHKAMEKYKATGIPVIATDSGIELEELGQNNPRWTRTEQELLDFIKDKENKRARHVAAVAFVHALDAPPVVVKHVVDGKILTEPRGEGQGSLFELATGKTLAELTPEERAALYPNIASYLKLYAKDPRLLNGLPMHRHHIY